MVVQSGWSGINDRVAKLGTGNKLSGFDTRDLQRFPAGGGAGSLAKVDSWVQVSQILSSESSGGEQQFLTYSFLENDFESQIPTQTSPISLTLSIADDDTLPGFLALKAASDAREQRVLRATLPGGSTLYYHAYVSLNETPSTTKGQLMAVSATFSLVSRFTRYSA
ncbi:phage tail protein [Parasalinivibrio latis]|uniref:phage tail protein n=1 Tax=Parasalinivibrio latis TaxID=2952610 RepID=UPI003DA26C89